MAGRQVCGGPAHREGSLPSNAFQEKHIDMEIKDRIADIIRSKKTQLPTLPVIVDNILRIANDERTSAKDLSDFVSKDQAIANKILKLANSAYYGMVKQVDSISRSIAIIGFNEVISLTIGMSVLSAFRQKDVHGAFNMKDLWLHAIGCATAAKAIAKKTGSNEAEQIFLIGLLHDIGKIVYAVFFPEEYRNVLEEAKKAGALLYTKEQALLGMDHAVLTGLLMKKWNFPDGLVYPSFYHHRVEKCHSGYLNRALVVALADSLCQKANIGHSGNQVAPSASKTGNMLKFSSESMEEIVSELDNQRPSIEAFFEIIQ